MLIIITEDVGARIERAKALLHSAIDASYLCINDDSTTILTRPSQTKSAIDLAFISPSIFVSGRPWMIPTLATTSPRSFILMVKLLNKKFFSHKVKHSKTRDLQFVSNLELSYDSFKEFVDNPLLNFEQKYITFVEHLWKQWPAGAPVVRDYKRFSASKSMSPAPWWNGTCQESVDDQAAMSFAI